MGARKRGLTRRQHIELGAQLTRMAHELAVASVLLANSYPRTAKHVKAANVALDKLSTLRCALDGVSANEIPGDGWSPVIYYGANDEIRNEFLARWPIDETEAGIDRLYG